MKKPALTPDEMERILTVKSFMLNNLNKKLTTTTLARRAAMNQKKFRRGFTMLFQCGPAEYLHTAKMQLGHFLLTHSHKPIKEIASLTGFRYSKNFMLAFKRFFNSTAKQVREKWLAKSLPEQTFR